MRMSPLFAGLAAAALLGGCGDGGPGPAPGPLTGSPPRPRPSASADLPADVDPASVFVQVSECFRAHGHPDFPDPVQGPDGGWGFPVTAGRVPVPGECADLARRAEELNPGARKSAAVDLEQRRAFARCMRDNGVADWPDPNADGTFALPPRLADPAAEQQWSPAATGPCRTLQPAGGPDIVLATAR
jgi:hypothetical protein